ncbi:Cathepsin_B [Hexamita inflata]|uniref:Cathepsin_B n=1 Tax=Hexamita inflata TaxID=28002 RepID=A0ABP1H7Q7_9EUKA
MLILSIQKQILENQFELLQNIPGLTWTPSLAFLKAHPDFQHPKQKFQKKSSNILFESLETFDEPLTAPEEFDWSLIQPACIDVIADTGHCPSYNAAAETQAFSDLRCISARDPERVQYSIQQVVDCVHEYGCSTYLPFYGWEHIMNNGIPTAECVPFNSQFSGYCSGWCSLSCKNGSQQIVYKPEKLKHVEGEEGQMMKAVVKGPLSASFTQYEDLIYYSSGIYTHQYGEWVGSMGAEIVGYGVENGVKFWKVKLPLGEQFGEKGFLRIAKGTGECGIESNGILGVV